MKIQEVEVEQISVVELTLTASKSYARSGDIYMSQPGVIEKEGASQQQQQPVSAEYAAYQEMANEAKKTLQVNQDKLSIGQIAHERKKLEEEIEDAEEDKDTKKESFLRAIFKRIIQDLIDAMRVKEQKEAGDALLAQIAGIKSVDGLKKFVTGFQEQNKDNKNPFANYSNDQLKTAYVQWKITLGVLVKNAPEDQKEAVGQLSSRYGIVQELTQRLTTNEMQDLLKETYKKAPEEVIATARVGAAVKEEVKPLEEIEKEDHEPDYVMIDGHQIDLNDVYAIGALDDDMRIKVAQVVLEKYGGFTKKLTPEQVTAIIRAHNV